MVVPEDLERTGPVLIAALTATLDVLAAVPAMTLAAFTGRLHGVTRTIAWPARWR
jgi:hypothetical protein